MRRKRSDRLTGMTSVNPIEELNNVLYKASDKRRKLANEYIRMSGDDGNHTHGSLERTLGVLLSEELIDFTKPPLEGSGLHFIEDGDEELGTGTWEGDKEGGGVDNTYITPERPGLPPDRPDAEGDKGDEGVGIPDRPVLIMEDFKVDENGVDKETTETTPWNSTDPIKPTFFEVFEDIKEEEEEKQKEEEEKEEYFKPGKPVPVEEEGEGEGEKEELKPQSDVQVMRKLDPETGKEIFYAYNPTTEKWYQVKFLEGLSSGQDVFMMDGMLYYYNQDTRSWLFYHPTIEEDGVRYYDTVLKTQGGKGQPIISCYNAEEGVYNDYNLDEASGYYRGKDGELFRLDIETNALVPVGTKADQERMNVLKAVGETYGEDGLFNLMYHNYSTYYNAWREQFPGVYPLTKEQYESQSEKIMALAWMSITQDTSYVGTFMMKHPEWAIAYSIFKPYTFYDELDKDKALDQLHEKFIGMNVTQQISFERTFAMQWMFDQPSVQDYLKENTYNDVMEYQKLVENMKNDPDNIGNQIKMYSKLMDIVTLVGNLIMTYEGSPGMIKGGVPIIPITESGELSVSTLVFQVIRMVSYYGFDISLAPTPLSLIATSAYETAEYVATNWGSGSSIVTLLKEGLSGTNAGRFIAEFGSYIADMGVIVARSLVAQLVSAGVIAEDGALATFVASLASSAAAAGSAAAGAEGEAVIGQTLVGEAAGEVAGEAAGEAAAETGVEMFSELLGEELGGLAADAVVGVMGVSLGEVLLAVGAIYTLVKVGQDIYGYYQLHKIEKQWDETLQKFSDLYKNLGTGNLEPLDPMSPEGNFKNYR